MKYLILSAIFLAQLAHAQVNDEGYGPYVVPDFQVKLPPPGQLNTLIPDLRGTCGIRALQWNTNDPLTITFNILARNIVREVEFIQILPNGSLLLNSPACGKPTGYRHRIVRNADGSKTINVECRGNSLRGQGSNRMSLTVNRNNFLSKFQMDSRRGWSENFYHATLDCRF